MNGFQIQIFNKKTEEDIFNTKNMPFIYSDRYIRFGSTLSSKYVYGLGERRRDNFVYDTSNSNDEIFTIWNKDVVGEFNTNLYSSHLVY